ncbi:TPA: hypothetical protein ACQ39K_001489 [Yersinia enterocolitica]
MLDDESIAKINDYFERLGIDFKKLKGARFVLECQNGEIVGHEFLQENDPRPDDYVHLSPSPMKIVH